jgi:hypothetical protein
MEQQEIKALLEQVLANQAVIYAKLRKMDNPNKSTPDSWILEELSKEAEKFKTAE